MDNRMDNTMNNTMDNTMIYTPTERTNQFQSSFTLQSWTKIIWTTAKNGVVPDTTSNVQQI